MRLARLRTERRMTQNELASALGVTPGAVANWECGIRTPRPQTLRRMAALFGVTIDYILGDERDAATSA